jgi:hypothetical protein
VLSRVFNSWRFFVRALWRIIPARHDYVEVQQSREASSSSSFYAVRPTSSGATSTSVRF